MSLKITFVGGGLPSLILAALIKDINTNAEVTIVERETRVGGQYNSFDYSEHGVFDSGIRLLYSTGIEEIDRVIEALIPKDEWLILEKNKKDLAGIFYNGRLQLDTPYVDLRGISKKKWANYVADLFRLCEADDIDVEKSRNCYSALLSHYGEGLTENIFVPIIKKLFSRHPSDLDVLALKMVSLNRVTLFEEKGVLDLINSDFLRSRIAYPEQRNLPEIRDFDQKAYYPREYGLSQFVEKVEKSLLEKDIRIVKNSNIVKMLSDQEHVSIELENSEKFIADHVFWSAGPFSLAKICHINMPSINELDNDIESVYVNLIWEKNLEMGDIYYFYCFDSGFKTFRVSNHSNYCPNASAQGRGFPICMEYHLAYDERSLQDHEIIDRAVNELKKFGVVSSANRLKFSKVERTMRGLLQPTLKNISIIQRIVKDCSREAAARVHQIGMFASKDVFFTKDILIDAYNKVRGLI